MPPAPAATPEPWFEARLAHAEPGRRVVEASAWLSGSCLGRSLGEAADAETAEDRALTRLQLRLGLQLADQAIQVSVAAAGPDPAPTAPAAARTMAPAPVRIQPAEVAAPVRDQPPTQETLFESGHTSPAQGMHPPETPEPHPWPAEQAAAVAEPTRDPDDWSDELAELEIQLARLQWDRNLESVYLQRAFGHPSRSRITSYTDLLAYVRALRLLPMDSTPQSAPVPLRRRDLLSQCDELLASLRWDASRGRQLLEEQFQLTSRQQLSDEQLLQFNMLLEEQLINAGSAPAAAANPG